MTARVLTAMENPWVDVVGHPTGRKLLRREPHRLDVEALIAAAGASASRSRSTATTIASISTTSTRGTPRSAASSC